MNSKGPSMKPWGTPISLLNYIGFCNVTFN